MDKPKIELNGWQTVRDYAKSKGFTTQVISNWIARDKIQAVKIEELNGLTLVKDKKVEVSIS